MKATGIIAEYNPFHNGHEYMMKKAREITAADYIVVVMSGAFVQRGEPAVLSKRARVEQALSCGADVVLELPFDCAVSSAQTFARGGIRVLDACNVVDGICFGSEAGDTNALQRVADALSHPEFDARIKAELLSGKSYPAARQAVLRDKLGHEAELLAEPNNLLGIEYLLAIKYFNSPLSACTVERIGARHDGGEAVGASASAFACRKFMKNRESVDEYLPVECAEILRRELREGRGPVFLEDMERAMVSSLRRLTPNDFAKIRDVSEGLEYLLCRATAETTVDGIITAAKSKRYTYSRIKRILMHAYLWLNVPSAAESMPEYIRLLGMKKSAAPFVREMREKATLPIIQRIASEDVLPPGLQREIRAADIWGAFAPIPLRSGEDWRVFPVILD